MNVSQGFFGFQKKKKNFPMSKAGHLKKEKKQKEVQQIFFLKNEIIVAQKDGRATLRF